MMDKQDGKGKGLFKWLSLKILKSLPLMFQGLSSLLPEVVRLSHIPLLAARQGRLPSKTITLPILLALGISISSNQITNAGVTSVNGQTGAVTVSAGISAVKGEIGSVVASNSVSMTLPSGGTWFVWNTASYSAYYSGGAETDYFGVKNTSASYGGTFYAMGGNFAGGTTVYGKTSSGSSGTVGKVVAVRVA